MKAFSSFVTTHNSMKLIPIVYQKSLNPITIRMACINQKFRLIIIKTASQYFINMENLTSFLQRFLT